MAQFKTGVSKQRCSLVGHVGKMDEGQPEADREVKNVQKERGRVGDGGGASRVIQAMEAKKAASDVSMGDQRGYAGTPTGWTSCRRGMTLEAAER